jgi:hypothetical protein
MIFTLILTNEIINTKTISHFNLADFLMQYLILNYLFNTHR